MNNTLPCVLYSCPGAFSLPTLDPESFAMETMLRFRNVRFIRQDTALSTARVLVPMSNSTNGQQFGTTSRQAWPQAAFASASASSPLQQQQQQQQHESELQQQTLKQTKENNESKTQMSSLCRSSWLSKLWYGGKWYNHAPSSSPISVKYYILNGLGECAKEFNNEFVSGVIRNDQLPALSCITTLCNGCIFPAFTFLVHYLPSLYNNGVCKQVLPKVGSALEKITGTYRTNVLRKNFYFNEPIPTSANIPARIYEVTSNDMSEQSILSRLLSMSKSLPSSVTRSARVASNLPLPRKATSLSVSQLEIINHVLSEVESAFRSIELEYIAYARADDTFILGTATPSLADVYAYVAISLFLHADFTSRRAATHVMTSKQQFGVSKANPESITTEAILLLFQQRIRQECPQLTRYVEKLRALLYDEYSGTYFLQSNGKLEEEIAEKQFASLHMDMYAPGRKKAIIATMLFTSTYFLMSNLPGILRVILLILNNMAEEKQPEEQQEEKEEQLQEKESEEREEKKETK